MARCVFVYTNFASLIYRDDLAFLQKGEKLRNLFFIYSSIYTFGYNKIHLFIHRSFVYLYT